MRTPELAWQNFHFTIRLLPRWQGSLLSRILNAKTGWWLNQPIRKNMSQNGFIFLKFRDENEKYLKPPPKKGKFISYTPIFRGDVFFLVSGRVFVTQCSAMSKSISANDGFSLVVWVGGLDSCDPLMKGIVGGSPRISNHQPKPPIFH